MVPDKKINAISSAADKLLSDDINTAKKIIEKEYPFSPIKKEGRNYTISEMMEQFFHDGFIDRYSGEKLINPGMLRVMSFKMPDVFPFHEHWKTDSCHMAYWDLQPTVDHIYPVSLGGKDSPENWASTSMINNSAKANFTLEQLGWTLKEKGDIRDWDGLSVIFVRMVETDEELLKINKIKQWYNVTTKLLEKYNPYK